MSRLLGSRRWFFLSQGIGTFQQIPVEPPFYKGLMIGSVKGGKELRPVDVPIIHWCGAGVSGLLKVTEHDRC